MIYAEFLNTYSNLQNLSLKACNIASDTFAEICKNLKSNKTLKKLDLYGNLITNLTSLGELLEINRSLTNLNLAGNSISDQDLAPLIEKFGKISYSKDQVEEYKRELKEKAKTQDFGKKSFYEHSFDEVVFEEENNQYFLLKNQSFKVLNLALNNLSSDHYLRLILSQSLPGFIVIVSGNPMPESVKNSLIQAFPGNLVF